MKYLPLLLLLLALPAAAQDTDDTPQWPRPVQAAAADGLALSGDFYLQNPDGPTALLLHQLYTTRRSWAPLLPHLLASGYNVLVVDLRGYGATRGAINWARATDDVQTWLDWLRLEAGVNGGRIVIIGSSMGANLAAVGCWRDGRCAAAVALSPGWAYFGVSVGPVVEDPAMPPLLVVYALRDAWPARGVPRMIEAAGEGPLTVQTYPGNRHGMSLLTAEAETLVPLLLEWLGEQLAR